MHRKLHVDFFFERRQDEDHDFSFGQRLMSDKKNLKVPDESVDVEVVCQEKSLERPSWKISKKKSSFLEIRMDFLYSPEV